MWPLLAAVGASAITGLRTLEANWGWGAQLDARELAEAQALVVAARA